MNDPTCTAPECAKRTVARGWCTMHYNRWRTFGTLDPVKKCVDCDTLIPRGRAVKVRCDFCAKDVAHQRNVDKWAETRAERATFTCRGCEGEFPRTESGRKRKWCDDCREQEKRRQSRRTCEIELAAKRVLFSQVGRISHCYRCSTEIENGRIGMKRLTCDDCRAKGYRSPVRRGTPTYGNVACQDCGGEFPNRSHNKTSKYCEPCTAKRCVVRANDWKRANPERSRDNRKQAFHIRRARLLGRPIERFKVREIFIRDKWRCGICHIGINRKLQYPDPMSSSIDHILPISEGGGHTRANVRATHLTCNVRRGARGGNEQLMLVG